MKIVHLVTSTTGGAAQAAIRLHEALLETSHDSSIISIERRIENNSSVFVKKLKTNTSTRMLSSVVTFLQRTFIQRGHNPVSPISLDLLDWDDAEVESADVIHLHAFYNLVSIRNFLSTYPLKRKVITLHDERFYTGGCHQSFECEQISTGCKHCPQVHLPFRPLISKQKGKVVDLIRNKANVVFVCPSTWILERAMKSFSDFPRTNFVQIYNPIPKNDLLLGSEIDLRKVIRFGFVSQNLENPIKNLNLLLEAFKEVNEIHPDRYSLTIVGESDKDYAKDNPKIIQKSTYSSLELQGILMSIDILVVPSTQDNLPNVMGEALMSGSGLIGSNAGGIPAIIELFNQRLFANGDKNGLIQAMLSCELPDRAQIQNQAEIVFGYKAIAAKMIQVYSSKLE